MKKIILISTLVISSQLFAQKQILDSIEVTATSSNGKSILQQPFSIVTLNKKELKRGTGLTLDDAININVPGVSMQRRTVGGGQQFNIRGYGNGARGTNGISSNFDGQGYKVYLNDIPITDAEGITVMDDIDFGSVNNVEIVKGAAGTLYGLAISGAVNLKTVKAANGVTSLSQDVILGNYGLRRFTSTFAHGTEKSSLLINYGSQHSDGYMLHTESDKKFINIIGNFTPNKKQAINTYFGYSNSYDQRGGELTQAQFDNNDYSGNPEYIKRNAHTNVVSVRLGVSHVYEINNHISNTTTVFGSGFNNNFSGGSSFTDKGSFNVGLRSTFNTKINISKDISLTGITGIETQYQRANTIIYNMKQNPLDTTTNGWSIGKPYWVINAATSNVFSITSTTSIFHQWTLNLPKDFSFTAGLGISNMNILLEDRFISPTPAKPNNIYDTSYKSMLSPTLAINKLINKNWSVYTNWSTGYKAPTSSYFYLPDFGRVNDVLKPEYAEQVEIGTKGSLLNNSLQFQIAWFITKYDNKMTAVAVTGTTGTTIFSYMTNGGSQQHNGIEALIKYEFIKKNSKLFNSILPFLNTTFANYKYKNFIYQRRNSQNKIESFDFSGKNVFGTPKIAASWGVDIDMKCGIYFNLTHLYRDGVNIGLAKVNNQTVQYQSSAYNVLNGKIGYRKNVSKNINLEAFIAADNITSVKYPLMIFANQLTDAFLPAAPNALVFGGINLKYTF